MTRHRNIAAAILYTLSCVLILAWSVNEPGIGLLLAAGAVGTAASWLMILNAAAWLTAAEAPRRVASAADGLRAAADRFDDLGEPGLAELHQRMADELDPTASPLSVQALPARSKPLRCPRCGEPLDAEEIVNAAGRTVFRLPRPGVLGEHLAVCEWARAKLDRGSVRLDAGGDIVFDRLTRD